MPRTPRVPLVTTVQAVVQSRLSTQAAGHGYAHVAQVVRNAQVINQQTQADPVIVEIGAWLHDIGDAKFHGGVERGAEFTRQILTDLGAPKTLIKPVVHIVDNISYRKGVDSAELSLAARVVQDADRLEALGVHGIIRAIEYGAHVGQEFHDPTATTLEQESRTTYGHFYEKLFKLADTMNTDIGKQIALERTTYMRAFLARYHQEISLDA